MKKRIIGFALAFLFVIGLVPAVVMTGFAAESGYLSELAFGSSTGAASKGNLLLDKPFNSETHDYTLYVKDSISSVSVWATLSSAGSGKAIKCKYKKTTGADNTVDVVSGNTTGKSLASFVAAKNLGGNTLAVEVGTQTYTVNVVRQATLASLSLDVNGNTVLLNEKFAAATTEYTAFIPFGEKITVNAAATVTEGTDIALNGKSANEPCELVWDHDRKSRAEIAVSKAGNDADTKTVYTVNITATPIIDGVEGVGSAASPYILKNGNDLKKVSEAVSAGYTFAGCLFQFANDITLPSDWTPIGTLKSGKVWATNADLKSYNGFSGIIDGANHTLTVPEGSKTMLGAVSGGKVYDLNIYGKKIDGYGVIEYYYVDKANPVKATIENVTLKSGTHTKYSGFIGGYASGVDVVKITDCTVEKGVIIGDDGTYPEWAADVSAVFNYPFGPTDLQFNDMIGSFGGCFNGTIENCVSYAKVYGRNYVGGIMGFKGQSMGDCIVKNCTFDGEVIAAGKYAGGIVGGGYSASSAPNTPAVTIENCTCDGKITGENCVGGIFGGEEGLIQCWENGIGIIKNNLFSGTVKATGNDAYQGGIIGFYGSLNINTVIENNRYTSDCGAEKGIGGVAYVDTDYDAPTAVKGVTYVNTKNGNPSISGMTRYAPSYNYYRSDDPLGKDADVLTLMVTRQQEQPEVRDEQKQTDETVPVTLIPEAADPFSLSVYVLIMTVSLCLVVYLFLNKKPGKRKQ